MRKEVSLGGSGWPTLFTLERDHVVANAHLLMSNDHQEATGSVIRLPRG